MNSLAQEKSPYLRQHADNPVAWRPWGEEAFTIARKENRPIFLSIGYSTCHWCHVMAHESFENPEMAAMLNRAFVPIKVDREERPDVDHLYMMFVQATTGQGGWPMSVWLTPDLKPFYGGTYFPPEDRWGRPGFGTVLERIADLWQTQHETILQQSNQVFLNLAESIGSSSSGPLPEEHHLEAAFHSLENHFEPMHGGFSQAPKFPRPSTLNFLLRYADRPATSPDQRTKARQMVLFTLEKMAAGGMHDHLGGGFHRYSVDTAWHVPHFEKMLYDQGQLACAYLEAYQLTARIEFAGVVDDILNYVRRDLTSPEGAFYAAEDADSLKRHGHPEHAEGAFYVWTQSEINTVLGEKVGRLFGEHYGVLPDGNAPEGSDPHREFTGQNILIQRRASGENQVLLAEACRQLWAVREKRPRPHRDEKILVAWNGLMISAFARAGACLDSPADLALAERAAEFILAKLVDAQGNLIRSYCDGPSTVGAFASDHAFFIQGLLDLYEATGKLSWLREAWKLQQKMDALFWDAQNGGYFDASEDETTLLLRLKETYDGAEPAANSVAADNLLRLADLLGEEKLRAGAARVLQSGAGVMQASPGAVPQLLAALTRFLSPPVHLVIAGVKTDPRTVALTREVQRAFLPHKTLLQLEPGDSLTFLGAQADFFRGLLTASQQPTAYVCENLHCHRPVTQPEELRALLQPLK
jgi:uncharacterized protein YyaL (SSP411 family)